MILLSLLLTTNAAPINNRTQDQQDLRRPTATATSFQDQFTTPPPGNVTQTNAPVQLPPDMADATESGKLTRYPTLPKDATLEQYDE